MEESIGLKLKSPNSKNPDELKPLAKPEDPNETMLNLLTNLKDEYNIGSTDVQRVYD
jgi:hypothetical protein